MLPAPWRIDSSHQLRIIFRKGTLNRSRGMSVFYLNASHPSFSSFMGNTDVHGVIGIVVPKKYSRLAVQRNKAKRRLRHIALSGMKKNIIDDTDAFIIRLDHRAKNLGYVELRDTFYYLFAQAKSQYGKKI